MKATNCFPTLVVRRLIIPEGEVIPVRSAFMSPAAFSSPATSR
jgi:hypothetical protein